jgi:hypothetical protein
MVPRLELVFLASHLLPTTRLLTTSPRSFHVSTEYLHDRPTNFPPLTLLIPVSPDSVRKCGGNARNRPRLLPPSGIHFLCAGTTGRTRDNPTAKRAIGSSLKRASLPLRELVSAILGQMKTQVKRFGGLKALSLPLITTLTPALRGSLETRDYFSPFNISTTRSKSSSVAYSITIFPRPLRSLIRTRQPKTRSISVWIARTLGSCSL